MLRKLIIPVSLSILPLFQPTTAQSTAEAEKTNSRQKRAFQLHTQKREALQSGTGSTSNTQQLLRGNVDSAASPLNVTQRKKGLPGASFKEISPKLSSFQNKKLNLHAEENAQRKFPLNAETDRAIFKPQIELTKFPAQAEQTRSIPIKKNAQVIKNKERFRPQADIDINLQRGDAAIDFPRTKRPDLVKFPSTVQPTENFKPIQESATVQTPELRLKSIRATVTPSPYSQNIPEFARKNNLLEYRDLHGVLQKHAPFAIPDVVRKSDKLNEIPSRKEEFVKGALLKPSSPTVPNLIERTDTGATIIPRASETDLKGELRKVPSSPVPTIGRALNLEATQLKKLPEVQTAEPAKLRTAFKKLILKPQLNFDFKEKSDNEDDGISWDEWFTRLARLSEPLLLKWHAFYGNPASKSTVELTVGSDHTVSAKIISGEDPVMNKATVDGFCALSGDERLKFPEGSRRTQITIEVDNEHEIEGDISAVETKTIRGDRELAK